MWQALTYLAAQQAGFRSCPEGAFVNLGVDHPKAAVVAIDLHRGHLDMAVATMPTSPEVAKQVIAANKRLFDWCRAKGIPIIHLLTQYRDVPEIKVNPFWRTRAEDPNATRKNVLRHNIKGMPGVAIIPELYDERDVVVDTKKRYDCFLGTGQCARLRGDRGQGLRRDHGRPGPARRRIAVHQDRLRLRARYR
jgi:nicotinamidase-related amidase